MKPFERAHIPEEERGRIRCNLAAFLLANPEELPQGSFPNPEAVFALADKISSEEASGLFFRNDVYQVQVRECPKSEDWPDMLWLSIKRIDREPMKDWRDFQAIKNELIGPENERLKLMLL